MILGPNSTWPEARNHCKIQCFFTIFGFPMFVEGFWVDFWMDLEVVLGSKLEPKSTKNLSKRASKIRYDFEWILDGSWTDFGSILEDKLGPSWL